MKVYISGPITGREHSAKLQFQEIEERLSSSGMKVINPFNLNHDNAKLWQDYMRKDIAVLMNCDAIYMCEEWYTSKGSRIEYTLAKELGIVILNIQNNDVPSVEMKTFDLKRFMQEEFILDISQKTRRLDIVTQRQYIMWWLREFREMTYPKIGKLFGMNHSTIIYAHQRINDIIQYKDKIGLEYIDFIQKKMLINGYAV